MGHKKREIHEEHENHERWLVTYADMVTLLMVLFIVMFAMSQVDQKKFNALRDGLAAGFGQSTSIQNGSSSILSEAGMAAQSPIAPSKFAVEVKQIKTSTTSAESKAIAAHEDLKSRQQYAEAKAEVDRLSALLQRLHVALVKHNLQDDVHATIDNRGLVLSLVSRHVVFQANMATLTPRGQALVDTIAPVLRDISDPLEIDGHTNQAKGAPKYFASDWDLSSARAVTVLRRLNEADAVPAARLTASAFGHTKPLIDPTKPGSQQLNKRVDIVILSALPSETRARIKEVIQAQGARGGLS